MPRIRPVRARPHEWVRVHRTPPRPRYSSPRPPSRPTMPTLLVVWRILLWLLVAWLLLSVGIGVTQFVAEHWRGLLAILFAIVVLTSFSSSRDT